MSSRLEQIPRAFREETIAMGIAIKRAYDPPSPDDGYRVLVDRLWP